MKPPRNDRAPKAASRTRDLDANASTGDLNSTPQGGADRRGSAPVRVPGLIVLYHPDLRRIGSRALLSGIDAGVPAELSRTTLAFSQVGEGRPASLDDIHVSRQPIRLLSDGQGGVRLQTDAARVYYTVDGQRGTECEQIAAERIDRGVVLGLGDSVLLLLGRFTLGGTRGPDHGMIGISDAIERLRGEVTQVAGLDVPVLIRGETGSGKERVARAIHDASRRAGKPFVAVNMAAIAPAVATSELFGHRRGAFTDAVANHAGFFGAADGGTLFLDEIGETPLAVQYLLLRALDEGQVQPVGGAVRTVDVRLITATDADLEHALSEGRFRDSLLHRLQVCTIDVPPLRRHREDVPVLLLHFLRDQLSALAAAWRLLPPQPGHEPWLAAAVVAELFRYEWPGNVRQLRNVAAEMAIRGAAEDRAAVPASLYRTARPRRRPPSGPIAADPVTPERRTRANSDGFAPVAAPAQVSDGRAAGPRGGGIRPADLSDDLIAHTMQAHGWNVAATARALGIAKNTLVARLRRLQAVRQATTLTAEEIHAAALSNDNDSEAMARQLRVSLRALQHRMGELRRLKGEDH